MGLLDYPDGNGSQSGLPIVCIAGCPGTNLIILQKHYYTWYFNWLVLRL
jgi:hypothetical protein